MIYLSGCVGPDVDPYRGHPRLGLLTGPGSYGAETVESWSPWAADNGCYSLAGRPFDEDRWLRWLDRLPRTALFAAAPDVLHWPGPVGDAAATLAQAERYLPLLRSLGFPAALVLQDGMTAEAIHWDACDAVFVGGSDPFKLGPVASQLVGEAKARGLHAHMGRVNSFGRLAYASAIGCDTADGTFLRWGPEANVPRMLAWLNKLDAGVQGVLWGKAS